jgi:hypothetical protein
MKFLVQKINKEIRHDFAFALIESARFYNWLNHDSRITLKYLNTIDIVEPSDIYPPFDFKHYHYKQKFVPIGSIDFVIEYLQRMYGLMPKPINVPEVLFNRANRKIFNGTESDLKGRMFVKSNDRIKGTSGIWNEGEGGGLPVGNYQFSEVISIDSEWRAFVYRGKLVGLQNYCGEFTVFPDVWQIKRIIDQYEFQKSAPIAYTLDVGVNSSGTFVIEVHDFFSCGLYGFADYPILPQMFYRWFWEYINKNK